MTSDSMFVAEEGDGERGGMERRVSSRMKDARGRVFKGK